MTKAQIAQTRALATLKIRTALYKRFLDRQEWKDPSKPLADYGIKGAFGRVNVAEVPRR